MDLQNQKLPLIVGTVIIIGVVAFVSLYKSSPGELSQAHASVAGSSFITTCKKCHSEKDVSVGCLQCHSEIQSQLNSKSGYHYFLAKNNKTKCAQCHSEHNGPQFNLINKVSWEGGDPKELAHAHLDFKLKEKHSVLACKECHKKSFILPEFPSHPRTETYLGLTQKCVDCHADVHAGGLATDCQRCHEQNSFRPAPYFNHDKYFPLGKVHQKIACNSCHTAQIAKIPAIKPENFPFDYVKGRKCVDCHENPHRTNWNKDCNACHGLQDKGWAGASPRMAKNLHAMTGFALTPPHNSAKCEQCHMEDKVGKGITFDYLGKSTPRTEQSCESCHRDPHGGQFIKKQHKCIDCHSIKSFKINHYGDKFHSIYPLLGKHTTVSCNSCHVKNTLGIRQYAGLSRDCASCHNDPHAGQFKRNAVTRCESCHESPKDWKKLVFNHNVQSSFKLDEAHRTLGCASCHPVVTLNNGRRITQYKPIRSECKDCHEFNQ